MIFVDTSFLVAASSPADDCHRAAMTIFTEVDRRPLITTALVKGEFWTLARRRWGHRRAVDLIDALDATPRCEVVHVDTEDEREAFAWLRGRNERSYSFVDATSFAIMRRRGITEALAFDRDFSAAGFVELRAG